MNPEDPTLRFPDDANNPNRTTPDLKAMLREVVGQVIDERLQPVLTELAAVKTELVAVRTELAEFKEVTARNFRVLGKKLDALGSDVLDLRGRMAVVEDQLPEALPPA